MKSNMSSTFFFSGIWVLTDGEETAPPRSANSQRKCAFRMQTSQPTAQTLNPLPCPGLTRRRHHPPALKDHPGARDELALEQLHPAQSAGIARIG